MPKKHKNLKGFVLSSLLLVFILTLSSLIMFTRKSERPKNDVLGEATTNQILYWEEFLKENPNYLPGWIEYSKLTKDSGLLEKNKEALEKIKGLDPNFVVEN